MCHQPHWRRLRRAGRDRGGVRVRADPAPAGVVRLGSVLLVAGDVTEARHHLPGEDAPSVIELRQGGGFGRTVAADPALAGFVGACDGELTTSQIVAALADLFEVPLADLWADFEPRIRELVLDGILVPAGEDAPGMPG